MIQSSNIRKQSVVRSVVFALLSPSVVWAQQSVDIQPLSSHVEALRSFESVRPQQSPPTAQPKVPLDGSNTSAPKPLEATKADRSGRNPSKETRRTARTSRPVRGSTATQLKSSGTQEEPVSIPATSRVVPAPAASVSPAAVTPASAGAAAASASPVVVKPESSGAKAASLAERQAQGDARLKGYDADIARAMRAIAEGNTTEAIAILSARWDEMIELEDFGSLGQLAYLAARVGDEALAVRAARKVAEIANDDEFFEILGNILIRFGRLDEAEAVLAKMDPKGEEGRKFRGSLAVNRAKTYYEKGDFAAAENVLEQNREALDNGGIELLAWVKYRLDKFDDAGRIFVEAYRKTKSESSAQGVVFSLHRAGQYKQLLDLVEKDNGPLASLISEPVRTAIASGVTRMTVGPDGRLAVMAGSAKSEGWSLRLEGAVRTKRGAAGQGRLIQQLPAVTLMWEGERDRLSLRIDGDRADDGLMSTHGTGWYGLWERDLTGGWSARIGLGRSSAKPVPGLGVQQPWIGESGAYYYAGDWGLGLSFARRPVQESLLALLGKPANGTDPAWGQVIQTGVTLSGNRKLRDWSLSLSATLAELTGTRVARNEKLELYSRAIRPVSGWDGLQSGLELIVSSYKRNLSEYQLGHGGYYSPRYSLQTGWVGVYDKSWQDVNWHLEGGLGYNWSRVAGAPGNPLTDAQPGAIPASHGSGVVYRMLVDANRAVSRQWKVGIWTEIQKAANYQDWRAGIYAIGPLK